MEDGVLDEFFGQIVARVDTEGKVGIGPVTEEPFSMLDEGYLTEKSAGIGQFDGNRRQGTVEKAAVVLVKAGLYVF